MQGAGNVCDRHSTPKLGDSCRIDQLMVCSYDITCGMWSVLDLVVLVGPYGTGDRFRLRIPDGGRLRWRVKIGAREFDVRDDHYDSRQW